MRMLVLSFLLLVPLFSVSQSKRTIPPMPDKINNISARIAESVSYNSYYGRSDDTDDWFSREDVGSSVYISDNRICFDIKNTKGKLFSFIRYIRRSNNLYFLDHSKEDYWKSEEQDEEKGVFGFTAKYGNDMEFLIKIIPEATSDGEELNYNYHTGKTEIAIKKRGKFLWMLYCKNYYKQ